MVKLVATLSSYGRRAVVVGGVADRYASELARAGQSNRRRAGTGSASSECATRPPLWPAGMAEGNRETFGPRVGLSSHGSPAKGGPKSKCLARLKIARTSAGPPSLTISDPSRFPLRVPFSATVGPWCCSAMTWSIWKGRTSSDCGSRQYSQVFWRRTNRDVSVPRSSCQEAGEAGSAKAQRALAWIRLRKLPTAGNAPGAHRTRWCPGGSSPPVRSYVRPRQV